MIHSGRTLLDNLTDDKHTNKRPLFGTVLRKAGLDHVPEDRLLEDCGYSAHVYKPQSWHPSSPL